MQKNWYEAGRLTPCRTGSPERWAVRGSRIRAIISFVIVASLLPGFAVDIAASQESSFSRSDDRPNQNDDPVIPPLSPKESLQRIRLADSDLEVELVAAEPNVVDPIAIRFDERGRMWVVEMGDYPHGPNEGEAGKSRIRLLSDRDGDGYFEHAVNFAEGLLFATGVQPWKNGAFVTMAGKVSFFADTNDDGVADSETTWFTGFAQENSQLRANHPTLNVDGKVYVANGLRGGHVVDARNASEPLAINGMDFAFDPNGDVFESVSGGGQFGMTFDEAGRRYICSNRNPLIHVVIDNQYSRLAPTIRIPSIKQDVAVSGFESRVYPISKFWTTSNLHAGQFTAACGATLFGGDNLLEGMAGNSFVCEPTGNLVHREVIEESGASFRSHSPYEELEFLASDDEWFRPVNLHVGPDGALYVVDMYRAVIEHPQFVPQELKNRPDQRFGDDRGRIYRIKKRNANGTTTRIPNTAPDNRVLLRWLDHSNSWQRETAFRLLLQDQTRLGPEALETVASTGQHVQARVLALWLLNHRDQLSDSVLVEATQDASPDVRETAIRIVETLPHPRELLLNRVAELCEDPSPRVRFQSALAMSHLKIPLETKSIVLDHVARQSEGDIWAQHAVMLAVQDLTFVLLQNALSFNDRDNPTTPKPYPTNLLARIATASSKRSTDSYERTRDLLLMRVDFSDTDRVLAVTNAIAASNPRLFVSLDRAASNHDELQQKWNDFKAMVRSLSSDDEAGTAQRVAAIELRSHLGTDEVDALSSFAWQDIDLELRKAAFRGLSRMNAESFWSESIERFSSVSPTIRLAILDGVLAKSDRIEQLLDAIQSGDISAAELDASRRQRLTRSSNAAIRQRATKVFSEAISSDRQLVYESYKEVLTLSGEPGQGRALFSKHCANCHRIGDIGTNVAPDISDSRVKSKPQLLTDILQPNLAIDAGYISYIATLEDGRVLTGVVSDETPTTLTLKQAEGKSDTLLRSEIEEITSTRKSLMPEGFENDLDKQAMADLISFIKNWRYLDGRVPAEGLSNQER